MPNLNVCTGPAFGVGSRGELEPANVRFAPWPFSSNPATASAQMVATNGLRYDVTTASPGGGLWVPAVLPTQVQNSQSANPGTGLPGGSAVAEASLTAVSFANPSPVQTMIVLASVTWGAVLASGTVATELWGGLTVGGVSALGFAVLESDGGAGSAAISKTYTVTQSFTFSVGPGSTSSMVPRIGVHNLSASTGITWTSWRWSVAAIGMLVDPVNVNTVGVGAIAPQTWTHGTAITPIAPVVVDSNPAVTSYTWSISPALPAGVNLNTTTGQISGTPTTAGTNTAYNLTATDPSGASGMTTFYAVVN